MRKLIGLSSGLAALILPIAAAAATLSVSPAAGSYKIGDVIPLQIFLNTSGQPIEGVDVVLKVSPHFEIISKNVKGAGLLPVTALNRIQGGLIEFSQVVNAGTTYKNSANQLLGTIEVKAAQAGGGTVVFVFTAGNTRDSNVAASAKDVLTSVVNGSYTVLGAGGAAVSGADADGDGLSDADEKIYGTDPKKADTDGDGFSDGTEVKNGYDPLKGAGARLSSPGAKLAGRFTRALRRGSRGEDVRLLQKILNNDPETRIAISGPGAPGAESDFFGALTERALQKWQAKNGIVSSGTPDTTGYGIVGPRTIKKLSSVLQNY